MAISPFGSKRGRCGATGSRSLVREYHFTMNLHRPQGSARPRPDFETEFSDPHFEQTSM